MNRNIFNVGLILLLSTFSGTALARKVLPIFANQWFSEAKIGEINSCNEITWVYSNLATSATGAITSRVANWPIDKGWHWGAPIFDKFIGAPLGFPSDWTIHNRKVDMNTILEANPNAPQAQSWGLPYFADGSHNEILPRTHFLIEPIYVCPPGSRITYDNILRATVCTTTPKTCYADIVGRNLDVPGAGGLGHVGITDNDNHVIEVLNDKEVIHTNNSLSNFKRIDHYWGERYGLDGTTPSPAWGRSFIDTANKQKHFDPEYTLTSFWQAGGYTPTLVYDKINNRFQRQRSLRRAKFRCDTFVNYLYNQWLTREKRSLLPRTKIILPYNTYISFNNIRNDVYTHQPNQVHIKEIGVGLNQPINQNHVGNLDVKIQIYLQDDKISRINKMNFLLSKLNPNLDHNFEYIMDTLASMNPHEMVPRLIQLYNKETNDHHQSKIIETLALSIQIQKESTLKISSIVAVQQFFITRLLNEVHPETLHQIIIQSLNVLPIHPDTYYLIEQAIQRLKSIDAKSLSSKQTYLLLLSMAFSTEEMQNWLLPKLLAQKYANNEIAALNNELLFIINLLDSKDLNFKTKIILQQYLHKQSLNFSDIESIRINPIEENKRAIVSNILHLLNTNEKATRINHLNPKILSALTKQECADLVKYFTKEMKKNPNQRLLYLTAISRLFDEIRRQDSLILQQ